jgi:DNA replication protein DnaC
MRKEQVKKNPRGAPMTPKQDDNTPKSLELSEGQLEIHFRRLNLAHTRRIYKEVADRAEKESWSYRDFLALLLAEEVARRKQTRLQRCTRSAHFPFFKTIDEFDFTLQSTLRESVIGSYLGLDFVTEGRSLILHGKTGRGKTHLAVAIGYRAIQNGFETLFTTAAELIEDLSNASKRGHLQESLATYTHPHVLVIDEVGYLTYGPDAANVLFHVVNDRHLKKRPMIFTTNKPLSEWGKVLHDEDMAAAILDRVLERGRFIHLDGPSGRTRHLNLEEILPASADRARISGINAPEFPEPTHAFRRFRITYLRQQGVQERLIKAWAGHSGEACKESVTDVYDRTEVDVKYRKEQAEKAGIGFTIPANVHIVQKVRKPAVFVAA